MEQARSVVGDILDEQIARIAREAQRHRSKANWQRRMDVITRVVAALLGVAAPVLVTYQTQVDSPVLKMLAIFVTGFIGAATGLQASFRWGDHYARSRLTSVDLDELESKTRLERQQILDSGDPSEARQRTQDLIKQSSRELQQIIRIQAETDVALLTERRAANRVESGPS